MAPRTVLTRSGPILLNTVRPINTVQPRTAVNNAGPMKNVINNAYSTARRPFNKITAANNSNFTKKVNTVKGTRVNTAKPKAVISAVKGNKRNDVKASACWQNLKDKGVIDSRCSRHMTGNRSYLTDYEEIDRGFVTFRGYSTNIKAFKVFNNRTRIIEENLHVQFSESTPNVAGSGSNWLFDIDALTKSMNYKPLFQGINLMVMQTQDPPLSSSTKDSPDARFKPSTEEEKKDVEDPGSESEASRKDSEGIEANVVLIRINPLWDVLMEPQKCLIRRNLSSLDDDEDIDAEADMTNLDTHIPVSPIPTTRIHKDHPEELLQFKLQEVWTLVELPNVKRAIGTRWVFRNKKDERGIVIKNKVRLVAQWIDHNVSNSSLRPDIMFTVCACARFQVNPKVSHLHVVKRIFRYLKGASLDRKSITGGYQFLGCRLISWQCKKQTAVANSIIEAEYIAASNSLLECLTSEALIEGRSQRSQIHAKVEGKKIVISESSMRRDLQFDDEDGSGQATDPQHTSTSVQPSNEEQIIVPSSSQPKKTHRPRKAKRPTEISQSSRPIPLVVDETVTKEREDIMEKGCHYCF
ncbi:uncharacterized mitochondrial protein-like protein [Tanacetum coccineum]